MGGGGARRWGCGARALACARPPPARRPHLLHRPSFSYRLHIWDVGGQRTLRPFWRNHFEATDALVWVVDAADSARLPVAAAELSALLAEERLAGACVLVIANKQDVAGAAGVGAVAAALGLGGCDGGGGGDGGGPSPSSASTPAPAPSTARGRAVNVCGAAAVRGEGVEEAFDWLVARVAERGGQWGIGEGEGEGEVVREVLGGPEVGEVVGAPPEAAAAAAL